MKTFSALFIVILIAGGILLPGCDNDPQPADASPALDSPAAALPAGLIVTEKPAGAQDVAAAKQSATDGQPIVVHGKIGGSQKPLAEARAMMTLLDPAVQTCDQMPGDACATPWDACCEPTEKIAAHSATVQVVDADGRPLPASLKTISALKPLAEVTVSGIARRPAGSDVLIVEAKRDLRDALKVS